MNKDQILEQELAKLGEMGSRLVGGAGGGYGAGIAARLLPTESHAEEHIMPYGAEEALTIMLNALTRIGTLQDSSEIQSPNPVIAAVVGAGSFNLNPCVITVEIVGQTESETTVMISGSAKEGLIKQNTAQRAVSRVMEAIKAV